MDVDGFHFNDKFPARTAFENVYILLKVFYLLVSLASSTVFKPALDFVSLALTARCSLFSPEALYSKMAVSRTELCQSSSQQRKTLNKVGRDHENLLTCCLGARFDLFMTNKIIKEFYVGPIYDSQEITLSVIVPSSFLRTGAISVQERIAKSTKDAHCNKA